MKNFTLMFVGIIGVFALIFLNFQLPTVEKPIKDQFAKAPFEAKSSPGWFQMKANQQLNSKDLLQKHGSTLGFSPYDKLELKKSETDKLGITHLRYDQYHRGIRIEGGEFFIHEKEGEVKNFNGKWISEMDMIANPTLSPNKAVQKGMSYMPAEKYAWEDEHLEMHRKEALNDPMATTYPSPELVWIDPSFSQNKVLLQLAYALDITSVKPFASKRLYLDAQTGELIFDETLIKDSNSHGTCLTKYSGNQNIVTDSLSSTNFRLVEDNRPSSSTVGIAVDILTRNLQGSVDVGGATDFTDDDNHWSNFNAARDEVATDTHWGAEKTFDFMTQVLDWNGIDNGSVPYRSYIHLGQDEFNAFWSSGLLIARFGDGDDPTEITPLTTLDIVGHEYTHGVIDFTANLRYQRESGALNESFADLVGTAIEFWAKPASADWLAGEEIYINGGFIRSLAEPKSAEQPQPDTYNGEFWREVVDCTPNSDNDQCGVHTNSGVQNKWFYILSVGESGTNDNGDDYNVTGIGIDKAIQIAFRNLRFNLGIDSNHEDALEGALQAAEDLFGKCSPEYVATFNAWFAVGVGNGLFEGDIQADAIQGYDDVNCGLSNAEFPTLDISYQSCVPALTAGTVITFSAQVDNGPITQEDFTLVNELPGFGTDQFTFTQPVSGLETAGMHSLKVWATFGPDVRRFNDTTTIMLENVIDQNTDFGGNFARELESGCFLTTQDIAANFIFLGCDLIDAGTALDVYYSINGGTPVKETTTLSNPIFRNGSFTYNFTTPLDLSSSLGTNKIDFWIDLDGDFLNENDSIVGQLARNPELLSKEELITFEAGEQSLDSIYFNRNAEADVYPGNSSKFDEPNVIEMTGGDFINSGALLPNVNNVWGNPNRPLTSQACFCVDASGLDQVDFSFDLYQSFSRMWQSTYGMENRYGSAVRVMIDNTQIGDTFVPETLNGDDVVNRAFNLDDYADMIFEVCIEARCGFSPASDQFGKGDIARFDNVLISGRTVGTKDLSPIPGLRVAPNPTDGLLMVSYPANINELQLTVFDIYGKRIEVLGTGTLTNGQIDLSTLVAGTYYLQFINGTQQSIEKVVVF